MHDAFWGVLISAFMGVLVSVFIEQWMNPSPFLLRPLRAWALHIGIWFIGYATLVLLLGRPWFAMALSLAFLLMLVMVNNAKYHSLHEPFVWHDFDYFTDAIRYPRLYIPFLGWTNFFLAAVGFLSAISVGVLLETVPNERFVWNGQLGGTLFLFFMAWIFIRFGNSDALKVSFDAKQDIASLGFFTSLWLYKKECQSFPNISSPFDLLDLKNCDEQPLPNIVTIQSESFFDARTVFPGIKKEVLSEFDRLKDDALMHGKLKVPAWGANTIRSEFAFLSGLKESELGVHRLNPYRAITQGWEVKNLVHFLKNKGYRTVAIHPYPISFYQRDKVYPKLGFDEFIDIRSFREEERFGPYIGDLAVARKVEEVLAGSSQPVFIFAITMENHGPLHLEKVSKNDIKALYTSPPPKGCDDLTIYLRHLSNADKMAAYLRQMLEQHPYPAHLCWFGDHVPIMPNVYKIFGTPNGEVDYLIWSNQKKSPRTQNDMSINELAITLLSA